MRSTKERVAAVRHRVEEIERQRQLRRNRVIGVFAAAACLVIIAGLSLAFPSLMADLPGGDYSYLGTAGSILDGRGAFAFIIIAFVLLFLAYL